MSPTVSQGLILPRCECERMCNVGLICGFSESTTGAQILQLDVKGKKKKERKRTWKHLFLHAGASGRQVEGNSREEALTSSSPHPSWALSSSKPEASLSRKKERGNDPSQTGSTARWPVAVYSKVGTVFSCRCVCVCMCVCVSARLWFVLAYLWSRCTTVF